MPRMFSTGTSSQTTSLPVRSEFLYRSRNVASVAHQTAELTVVARARKKSDGIYPAALLCAGPPECAQVFITIVVACSVTTAGKTWSASMVRRSLWLALSAERETIKVLVIKAGQLFG